LARYQPFSHLNPIRQDTNKRGEPRLVSEPYPFNYGAFPQTWENPFVPDKWTSFVGDKDPLDVCEIGSGVYYPGDIVTVKVLGILGLLGNGDETDWKIIVIDVTDPLAKELNDASDLSTDVVHRIVEFFTFYKVPNGENPSSFVFDGQLLNKTFATTVVEDKHSEWKQLMQGTTPRELDGNLFQTKCVLCTDPKTKTEFKITAQEANDWAQQQFELYLYHSK